MVNLMVLDLPPHIGKLFSCLFAISLGLKKGRVILPNKLCESSGQSGQLADQSEPALL